MPYLNPEAFTEVMREKGWKSLREAARALNVSHSMLSKALAGQSVGGNTIDRLLAGCAPRPYADLFMSEWFQKEPLDKAAHAP